MLHKAHLYWFLVFSAALIFLVIVLTGISDTFPNKQLAVFGAITLAIVFLFAGKGFWGVCVAAFTLYQVTRLKLTLDAFFPDKKGGFSILETFLHKASGYFFTGGLLLPMAYEFGMGAFHDWAKIIVAAFLVIFFGTGITGLVLGKCLIIPAYQRARRTAMKDASRQMAVSKTREEQERSEKLLVQLEKIGETPIDKKKLASVLLQPLLNAAPLAGYGEGVQKFFQDVLKTL